jgi:hypothetical protein
LQARAGRGLPTSVHISEGTSSNPVQQFYAMLGAFVGLLHSVLVSFAAWKDILWGHVGRMCYGSIVVCYHMIDVSRNGFATLQLFSEHWYMMVVEKFVRRT